MRLCVVSCLMACLLGTPPALAATEVLQPVGGPLYNTPPLVEGESSSAQFELIFGSAYPNWAGIRFTLNWDPTEANMVGLTPGPGFNLVLGSTGTSSLVATLFHVGATAGGITVSPLSIFNPATVNFQAINSTTANNSDIDIWIGASSVAHIFVTSSAFSFVSSLISAPGGIGIEHLPEPASGLLVLGGLLLLGAARRREAYGAGSF